jgi:cell division septation protein DedD
MKSKYLLVFLVTCILFTLDSCKSKESAYKAAYAAAKAKEVPEEATVVTPIEEPEIVNFTPSEVVLKEKITVIDDLESSISQYNVVIGSFTNKTNALSLKERMVSRGYSAFLARNEKGMYRVIVATSSSKADAAMERDNIRNKYPSEFQDAWILDKN